MEKGAQRVDGEAAQILATWWNERCGGDPASSVHDSKYKQSGVQEWTSGLMPLISIHLFYTYGVFAGPAPGKMMNRDNGS